MAVDYFGRPADMKNYFLAKKYNLKTISDTAQAIGAKYHGKYAVLLHIEDLVLTTTKLFTQEKRVFL